MAGAAKWHRNAILPVSAVSFSGFGTAGMEYSEIGKSAGFLPLFAEKFIKREIFKFPQVNYFVFLSFNLAQW
ncbi:GerW family sporulation protein, partial [Salmonella enterica]|uniref:GerW family sporulation protein n=1 Tax=Salmonella enterica TaxID=28901 RepID=UPI0035265EC2